jgi:hypothetical protein
MAARVTASIGIVGHDATSAFSGAGAKPLSNAKAPTTFRRRRFLHSLMCYMN